ncbi:hypothetical protein K449DRAFT_432958 [Hypoxylon sp. EC38]|nr:hypothetical protein K449DRAFT_432958 [Hypoxylon sp. EC38]
MLLRGSEFPKEETAFEILTSEFPEPEKLPINPPTLKIFYLIPFLIVAFGRPPNPARRRTLKQIKGAAPNHVLSQNIINFVSPFVLSSPMWPRSLPFCGNILQQVTAQMASYSLSRIVYHANTGIDWGSRAYPGFAIFLPNLCQEQFMKLIHPGTQLVSKSLEAWERSAGLGLLAFSFLATLDDSFDRISERNHQAIASISRGLVIRRSQGIASCTKLHLIFSTAGSIAAYGVMTCLSSDSAGNPDRFTSSRSYCGLKLLRLGGRRLEHCRTLVLVVMGIVFLHLVGQSWHKPCTPAKKVGPEEKQQHARTLAKTRAGSETAMPALGSLTRQFGVLNQITLPHRRPMKPRNGAQPTADSPAFSCILRLALDT